MKVFMRFKYKLNPTAYQKQKLLQFGGCTRFLWNQLLEENLRYEKLTGEYKNFNDMTKSIIRLKQEHEFLKEAPAQSLQRVARHQEMTINEYKKKKDTKDYFKKKAKREAKKQKRIAMGTFNPDKTETDVFFPNFKKKSSQEDAFYIPQAWSYTNNFVKIPKIGEVKWIKHRPLRGKPKSITITQHGKDWFCTVLCEVNIIEQEMKDENIAGVDLNLIEFAVLSDGTRIERQRFTNKNEKKLAREQRRLSRKVKGSNNYEKQRRKLQKVHDKIANQRKDFLNKTSHFMITKYDGFSFETLNIQGMVKNHKLAKSIHDVSWYEFKRQMEYKSKWNFKYFIEIGTFEPSTKMCSGCGSIKNMKLSDRTYECPKCGLEIDRDLNAAINIRNIGLRNTFGLKVIYACGDDVRQTSAEPKTMQSSVKQENGLNR